MFTYPTFEPGEKVRTVYGEIRTVLFQRGRQVFVEEESRGWYHPTKVWQMRPPDLDEQPWVPET
jgi:hypothetical protein